jgi:aryl-alcohol dehydrogenase
MIEAFDFKPGRDTMQVKAAVLRERNTPLVLESITIDNPRADEVLVRIVATGICHSDVSVINGDLPLPTPIILGHEGSGIVEAVGSAVTRVAPGDHVVLSFAYCGKCIPCRTGHPVYCDISAAMNLSGCRADGSTAYTTDHGFVHGHFVGQSSFASHALVHESAAVRVDSSAPLEMLAPLGCGIQTGAGTVLNLFRPNIGGSLAVTGTGPVGLSGIMAAHLAGCATIIAVDISEARLTLARELGATHTINASSGDITANLRDTTGGRGLDFILDTTGKQDVMSSAYAALSTRGRLGLVGVSPAGTRIDVDPWTILGGRSIEGNMEGDVVPDIFIPYLIELNRQGRFPFEKMITQVGNLDDLNTAIDDSRSAKIVKAVVALN